MNDRALRVAGASLVAAVALWAGVRLFFVHPMGQSVAGIGPIPVPTDDTPIPGEGAGAEWERVGPLPQVPERLPPFTLADRAGKPRSIAEWQDKSLIINFWATWCAPCRHEIPLLQSLAAEWGGRGMQVVGIAVDHRPEVLQYADELKISYPLLIGEQDAMDVAGELGFESPVFPFTVFTDRRGEVVTLFVGELHKAQADLILSVVQNLNENQLQLPQARRSIADGLRGLAPQNRG
jgi:thiol-disulfide isomerase/thioredoxin